MLQILQARLQQHVNWELPDVQAGFRKGGGTRVKLPTSAGSSEKQKSSSKTSISDVSDVSIFFIDHAKAFDCVDHNTATATAKSLQLCPTLCDPIDGSPPGSPIPGIIQARTLEWVAISFSNAWKWKVKVKSLSRARLLATPWIAAH